MTQNTLFSAVLLPLLAASISLAADTPPPATMPTASQLLGLPVLQDDDVSPPPGEKEAKSPWKGSVGLSLSGNQGTSSSISFRFSTSATRKTDLEEFNINVTYYYEYKNGSRSENNGNLAISQVWNLGPDDPWNIFAQGNWLYDATEGFVSRVNAYGGAGYKAINRKDLTLNLKLGLGAQWEYRENTAVRPQTLLEANNEWQISEGIKFTGSLSIANDVQKFENYLATIKAEFNVEIADIEGLALNVGIRDIYNSNPGADSSYNQLWYWIGLKYGF
ncbi:MAG: DUF481 domain-containing protein [Phycisphaerales bacterium]|nr:DUF481 domain-containing protein [Phycisphaerales bacterium]